MAVNNLTCCFCLWDGVIGRLSHFPRQDHQQEKADHVEFDHFVQESKGATGCRLLLLLLLPLNRPLWTRLQKELYDMLRA